MAEQLPLDLPSPVMMSRENYVTSDANALAFRQIDAWHNWPERKLVLVGARGAGKTHLARIWAQDTGARVVQSTDIAGLETGGIARLPMVVEDIDRVAGDLSVETALFHLHNLCLAEGRALLMTAEHPPNQLSFALPDLTSRLGATTLATLDAPDDALLSAILVKLFADRHISIKPKLLDYAVPRLPRSTAALAHFVARTVQRAADEDRKIGLRLARDVLAETTGQVDP